MDGLGEESELANNPDSGIALVAIYSMRDSDSD